MTEQVPQMAPQMNLKTMEVVDSCDDDGGSDDFAN